MEIVNVGTPNSHCSTEGSVEGVWTKKYAYNDRYSLNVRLSYTMPIMRTTSFSPKKIAWAES